MEGGGGRSVEANIVFAVDVEFLVTANDQSRKRGLFQEPGYRDSEGVVISIVWRDKGRPRRPWFVGRDDTAVRWSGLSSGKGTPSSTLVDASGLRTEVAPRST